MRILSWPLVALILTMFALADSSREVSAQDDLVLHLTFDSEDELAKDVSGNDLFTELDDTGGVQWLEDEERGGVVEFPGSTNGFISVELPDQLPGDSFTIAFWAYRDPLLAGGTGGDNDGLFQVQLDPFFPSTTTKVVGGWVHKTSQALWGRVRQEDGTQLNLDQGSYTMDDEVWVHLAYRGDGDAFEIVVNGESGVGPMLFYDGTLEEHDAIFVGRQGAETWGGRLDDFRVYSRALSDEEIQELMGGIRPPLGDFNRNGVLDAEDIDLLSVEVRAGLHPKNFDLDNDSLVNEEDRRVWVEDLKYTYFGDANLDLEFNSGDMVQVFAKGKYEAAEDAGWEDGDWNGDGRFGSGDMVTAFVAGGYEQGKRPAVAHVPEPAAFIVLAVGLLGITACRRRSQAAT